MRLTALPQISPTTPQLPVRAFAIALLTCAVALAGFAIGSRVGTGQGPDRAATLGALIERAGGAVVYSEFGETADTIWAANPSDPSDRIPLASPTHAAGFGILPALAPDGSSIAYAVATGPRSADLWLLDIASAASRRLAADVDLAAPVWSDASDAVVVSRTTGGEGTPPATELLRVGVTGAVATIPSAEAALYPIGLASDGALYYASLSADGTDLRTTAGGGAALAKLSDGIARDWSLSPDGSRLAYLAQRAEGGYEARILDMSTGEASGVSANSGLDFNPTWSPDGSLTVGRLGERLSETGAAAGPAGSNAGDGFDVPLAWSPDGAYLIVRHFEGDSSSGAGPSWVWSIDHAGQRQRLSDISDVTIAGWLTRAP